MTASRRVFFVAAIGILAVSAFAGTAMAAGATAGTFSGPTSQIGAFGLLGRQAHGRIMIIAGYVQGDASRPAVSVDPAYETRCQHNRTSPGFYSNRQIPKALPVHGRRFTGRFTYSEQTHNVTTEAKVAGRISGSLSGKFKTPRLIVGQVALTVRVFQGGRQLATCTAKFTYTATWRSASTG